MAKKNKLKSKNINAILNIPEINTVLNTLLKDKTTGENIVWGTDNYEYLGDNFKFDQPITIDLLTGKKALKLRARVHKSSDTKKKRTKGLAEVMTPSWTCNFQNSKVDEIWFEKENVFNKPIHKTSWVVNKNPIEFSGKKTWEKYVLLKGIEITCGEAPYMTSRYDTTTGKFIDVHRRIGFLDRKLRVINENVNDEETWFKWVLKAYQSSFGYEFQGDSLLIARLNLLLTFIENFKFKWNREPSNTQLKNISNVISWNVWQMDGLNDSLILDKTIPCIIRNWRQKKNIYFKNIKKGEKGTMKFDFCIGNPPYMESKKKTETQTQGNSNYIYQHFQKNADVIANITCLIYPFGGWFDAPDRLGGLGNSILKDKHTVLIAAYEGTNDKRAWYRTDKFPDPIFGTNANLSAGVAIVIRDMLNYREFFKFSNRIYSDIEVHVYFSEVDGITPNPEFLKINRKLGNDKLSMHVKNGVFGIESDFAEKNPDKISFKQEDWNNPIQLLTNDKSGSSGRATLFWVDESIIEKNKELISVYKVITSSAYPKKTFVSGKPTIENIKKRAKEIVEIMPRKSAFGRSRMLLFSSEKEADCKNFLKYTQTNFFAGLLIQEPNRSSSIGFLIPYQDFTENSDIDWSKSTTEIDQQLYKKYGLTQKEIDFIEAKVRSMDDEAIEKDGEN